MLEQHGFSKNTIVFLRSQPSLSDDQDPKKLPSWGLPGVTMGQRQGGGGKGAISRLQLFSRVLPPDGQLGQGEVEEIRRSHFTKCMIH